MELIDIVLKYGDSGLTILVLGYMVYRNGRIMENLIARCIERLFEDELDTRG